MEKLLLIQICDQQARGYMSSLKGQMAKRFLIPQGWEMITVMWWYYTKVGVTVNQKGSSSSHHPSRPHQH
jgi:hypothetical protein